MRGTSVDVIGAQGEPSEIDQMKKDSLYDIGRGNGQIRVVLQWIYSKVKLLSDILESLELQIENDLAAKEDYEYQLKAMDEPFGNLLTVQV